MAILNLGVCGCVRLGFVCASGGVDGGGFLETPQPICAATATNIDEIKSRLIKLAYMRYPHQHWKAPQNLCTLQYSWQLAKGGLGRGEREREREREEGKGNEISDGLTDGRTEEPSERA